MPPLPMLEALKTRPFVPFRIFVADGPAYEIRHPDLLWIGPGYVIVGLPPDKPKPRITIQRHVVVSLGHITRMEPMETAGAESNGA